MQSHTSIWLGPKVQLCVFSDSCLEFHLQTLNDSHTFYQRIKMEDFGAPFLDWSLRLQLELRVQWRSPGTGRWAGGRTMGLAPPTSWGCYPWEQSMYSFTYTKSKYGIVARRSMPTATICTTKSFLMISILVAH